MTYCRKRLDWAGMQAIQKIWRKLCWGATPPWCKKRLLNDALQILDQFGETHDLLALARAEGVTISISPAMIGSGTNGHFGIGLDGRKFIELAPRKKSTELASTLIHELRHVWQSKVMGMLDKNAPSKDDNGAEFMALMTRVREADAFAFTAAMIQQMNYATRVLSEAARAAGDLLKAQGRQALTRQDIEKLQQQFKTAPVPDPRAEMERVFRHMLPALDEYDRTGLRHYHVLFTHPDFAPQPHRKPDHPLDVAKLRQILKAGIAPDAPAYLADLDDSVFKDTVMNSIAPKIRRALSLMDAFEAAAAKGNLSANDNHALREKIHTAVRAAQAEPKPDLKKLSGPRHIS